MIQFFRKRPWILVVVAFIILVAAWVSLITVAENNKPPPLEVLKTSESD